MRNSRVPRIAVAVASLTLAAAISGCQGDEIEAALGMVAWFSNMKNQPAVEPYEEAPRTPPEGTIAVGTGVPFLGQPPDNYEPIPNPVPADERSLEIGKENYDIFCNVCHGPEGRGGGSVEGPIPRGLLPLLTTQRAQEYSDGYLFGMITVGRGLMPNYRRIPQEDRWHIVNYVRQLQEEYGE